MFDASGDELIAVRRSGLTDEQKVALAIYDNRGAELAEWNIEQLVQDQANGIDLTPYFFAEELAALLPVDGTVGLTDPDETPEPRATDIVLGDLFVLGRHRLLCGDSTNAADVARLIAGATVAACITDPPYSVNYDRSQSERGGSAEAHDAYHEADINPEDLLSFMMHVPSDVLVMSYPVDRHFFALASAYLASGFEVRKELVWVKDQFSFWPGAKYQQKHEPIMVCAKKGRPINADVPANQSTVFEFPRPRAHSLHPTQKPIELWALLVEYHVPSGASVYEPFSGSGTTIMAATQLNRECYAIEKAPQYVQIAIDRWEAFTGLKAIKVDA